MFCELMTRHVEDVSVVPSGKQVWLQHACDSSSI